MDHGKCLVLKENTKGFWSFCFSLETDKKIGIGSKVWRENKVTDASGDEKIHKKMDLPIVKRTTITDRIILLTVA